MEALNDLDFQWDGVINGKRKNRIYSYKLSYETLNGASSEIDGLICSTPNIEETTCFNHCENCYTSGDLYSYNPNNPTEILNPPEFYNWTSLDNSEIKNGFCCKTQ